MGNKLLKILILSSFCLLQINCAIITVGRGGDYPATNTGLQNAIGASSNGDTVLILANNTINVDTATITVDKEITLQGEDKSKCEIYTIANLPELINVISSNVSIKNLTLINEYYIQYRPIIIKASSSAGPVIDNFLCSDLVVKTTEYGFLLYNCNNLSIKNCTFTTFNPVDTKPGYIFLHGLSGSSTISNNIFNSFENYMYTECVKLTGSESFSGTLTVSNNKFTGGGLNFFVEQDNFTGNTGDFKLIIEDNNVINTSAQTGKFLNFYATSDNPLDLYSQIIVNNNFFSNAAQTGLVYFNGANGPLDVGDLTNKMLICNNTLGTTLVTLSAVDATDGRALVGYDSAVFNRFTYTLPPCVSSSTVNVAENYTKKVFLNGMSYYPNNEYTFSITSQPSNGTLSSITTTANTGTNLFANLQYTPNNGFKGTDTFEFVLSDGSQTSQSGVITLNVADFGIITNFVARLIAKY